MKTILIFAVFFVLSQGIYTMKAQTPRFELELDPIAYILKGYSVHGIYVIDRLRFDIGIFGIAQPEQYHGNKGFESYMQGCGLKINYLLDEEQHWFAGIDGGILWNSITLVENQQMQQQKVYSIGIHSGYRFYLSSNKNSSFSGFYIAPWIGLSYNIPENSTRINGLEFKQKSIGIFPTVHIGFKI
jgi:hypothetical protein